MSISAISNSSATYQPNQQDGALQDFMQLIKAIKSGDLKGAQQAYAAFSQAKLTSGAQTDPNSPFSEALKQIGQALQSGNIGDAQQALSSLQNQMHAGHHHRHHVKADAGNSVDSTTPTATNTSSTTTSNSNNLIDITA